MRSRVGLNRVEMGFNRVEKGFNRVENGIHIELEGCQLQLVHPASSIKDTLAERLRRRPAKPMGSPRVGSNPTGVVFCKIRKGEAAGFEPLQKACVAATAQLVP